MLRMFKSANVFNSDISHWDTSKVADMVKMFNDARVFDLDISGWDVSKVTSSGGFGIFTASNRPTFS
jgi:surface protein